METEVLDRREHEPSLDDCWRRPKRMHRLRGYRVADGRAVICCLRPMNGTLGTHIAGQRQTTVGGFIYVVHQEVR